MPSKMYTVTSDLCLEHSRWETKVTVPTPQPQPQRHYFGLLAYKSSQLVLLSVPSHGLDEHQKVDRVAKFPAPNIHGLMRIIKL